MGSIKYAVYPGTVTLLDGEVKSFTALELAQLYGVQDEYTEVTGADIEPHAEYIHLKPRPDGRYEDMKMKLHDNGQQITWDEGFKEDDPKYRSRRA